MRLCLTGLLLVLLSAPAYAQSGTTASDDDKSPKAKSRAIVVTPKGPTLQSGPPQDRIPIDSNSMKVIGPGSPGSGGERSKSRY